MCGIAGIVSWDKQPQKEQIKKLSDAISHRGPDGEGFWNDQHAQLAHKRLSIIDLTSSATQPMQDDESSTVITFNGEIYNYQELRFELETLGHSFKSKSDTEVILKAHSQWGIAAIKKLHGMFAYALWNFNERSLLLVRDRLGKKPLFFSWENRMLVFASELAAFGSGEYDERSLNKFLMNGYVTGESTVYKNIKKVLPSHWVKYSQEGQSMGEYWNLSEKFIVKSNLSYESATERFKELLIKSVKKRLIADVPIGVALSGGKDSNIVAMLASGMSKDIAAFTIGFTDPYYDESDIAIQSAKLYGLIHHKRNFTFSHSELIRSFSFAEWVSDNSFLATTQLFSLASETHKVILTGDGGDELLGGYPTYKADFINSYFKKILAIVPKDLKLSTAEVFGSRSEGLDWNFKIRQFLAGSDKDFRVAHLSWRKLLNVEQRQKLLTECGFKSFSDNELLDEELRYYADVREIPEMEQNFYVDMKSWLIDDVLVKVDRASMANGVEARSPFLDHELVEFVASLPIEYKWSPKVGKRILNDAFQNDLPTIVKNGNKKGFNVPVGRFTKTPFADDFRSYLYLMWKSEFGVRT